MTTRSVRYGETYDPKWHRIKDVSANESKPTAQGQCLRVKSERLVWMLSIPNGVTDLVVHVGRWVDCPAERGFAAISEFAEDEAVTLSGLSGGSTEQIVQDCLGDDLGLYVTGFTGSGTIKVAVKYIGGGP